jgi:hypothetical protein
MLAMRPDLGERSQHLYREAIERNPASQLFFGQARNFCAMVEKMPDLSGRKSMLDRLSESLEMKA